MTPTPTGVGHLISPRWLEEMSCFSLSLSLSDKVVEYAVALQAAESVIQATTTLKMRHSSRLVWLEDL